MSGHDSIGRGDVEQRKNKGKKKREVEIPLQKTVETERRYFCFSRKISVSGPKYPEK